MRVAVIDVGSGAVRLLVADWAAGALEPVVQERTVVALGAEIERRGELGPERLALVAERCRRYARAADEAGAQHVRVVVSAPGRAAANASELLTVVECATGYPATVLAELDEGCLAFEGALALAGDLPDVVAVARVGADATEIVVGTTSGGPAWGKAVELGCVRLTERARLSDPPSRRELARGRAVVEEAFARTIVPFPQAALASGGPARGLARLVGPVLDPGSLAEARHLLRRRPARELERRHGIDPVRARSLAAAALILAVVQQRLVVPLTVARGGVCEGAALQLVAEARAA